MITLSFGLIGQGLKERELGTVEANNQMIMLIN